ncbi:MAG: HDOD domain-containing protein [Candidatus Nealsonbacteria bacterium]|nr:HDOD domain-containing protein [Candidatus Nealsonbacteria bacterium]
MVPSTNPTLGNPQQLLPDHAPQKLVERLFTRISEVSTLPQLATKIVALVDDPTTGAEDVLVAVRADPALAMRLMRTVNSSYYGLEQQIGDLRQAITLLGFKEVRNLALTSYVSALFREPKGYGPYSRRGLWEHLVSAGMVAREVARTCGRVPPEEAYLAGLLHDVGHLLIDQYVHHRFRGIIDSLREETLICSLERERLGFDHAMLGEFVSTRWDLPPHLTAAVGHHHEPDLYTGDHHDMVLIVAVANFFCHLKKLPSLGVAHDPILSSQYFVDLEMDKSQVGSLLERLDDLLHAAGELALVGVR